MKISEMKVGQSITARLVLAGASLRQTKGNPPRNFLSADLTDGTDTLDGKIWNYTDKSVPETNKIYDIAGNISEYQGKKQINITGMSLSADQNMTGFSCTYCDNIVVLENALTRRISKIEHKYLYDITKYIYDSYWKDILNATSAKGVHHVGIGGNACHSIEVFDIGERLADYYVATRCLDISVDLVRAGALLHDIGKVFTYSIDGAVIGYTENGHLFDHIVNGMAIMGQASQHFGCEYNETIALLGHIITSHHGQLEYGSPVTPKFVEAYIVSQADGISATLDTLLTANDKAIKEGKDMTDVVYTLNNRQHFLQKTIAERLGRGCNP